MAKQDGEIVDDYRWMQNRVILTLSSQPDERAESAEVVMLDFARKEGAPEGVEPELEIIIKPDMWERCMPGTMYPQNVRDAGWGNQYICDQQTLSQLDPQIFEFTRKVIADFGQHFGVAE